MFGLMRPAKNCSGKNCNTNSGCKSDYVTQRTHYCGTCKTIGKAYGHKARMLLNFDTVFLAELLSQLSGEDIQQWAQPYQAINKCFVMPENETNAPASLKFAAAANVVLGALKMDDNIRDKAQRRYKFARWFFSKSFKKAAAELETWGVPQTFLWEKVETQTRLEKQPFEGFQFADLNACLDTFAHPTAEMTAEIFAKGALFVQNPTNEQFMRDLGYEFGRLAYVLDAFEDIEKDVFNGEFNPIAQFFGLQAGESVPETILYQTRQSLELIETNLYAQFATLGLGAEADEKFMVRLSANLSTRIYKQRTLPRTLRQRIQQRWANAKETAEQLVCRDTTTQKLKYMLVAMAVFALPQVTEHLGASDAGKGQILGWFGIFSAMLAGVGLSKSFWAAPLLPQEKKKESAFKRFKNWLNRRRSDCVTLCLSDCCEICCTSCLDGSCNTCCSSCCDDDGCCNPASLGDGDCKSLLWGLLLTIILVIIVILVFAFLL